MDAKDKALVAKTEPKEWRLGDLVEFWARQGEPDMARQCSFQMGRLQALRVTGALDGEKRASLQFLGDIYNNASISRQPIKKGDILDLPESQVKYLLETFPKNWQKVKVEKGEKVLEDNKATTGTGTNEPPKLRRS